MNGIRGRRATPVTNTYTGHIPTTRAGQAGNSSLSCSSRGGLSGQGSCKSAKRNWGTTHLLRGPKKLPERLVIWILDLECSSPSSFRFAPFSWDFYRAIRCGAGLREGFSGLSWEQALAKDLA